MESGRKEAGKMDKKGFWERYGGWAALAVTAGLLCLAGITLHDMQTAEGTGLYLAICAGQKNRIPFDLLVDLLGLSVLAGAVFLPCLIGRRLHADSFLRLLCAYIAFLPVVSTASLVHLLDGTTPVLLRDSLLDGRIGTALLEGLKGPAPILGTGLPVLVLAGAALKGGQAGGRWAAPAETGKAVPEGVAAPAETGKAAPEGVTVLAETGKAAPGSVPAEGRKISAGMYGFLMVQVLLLAGGILFPALEEQCWYLICYCLLLYGFFLWEKILDRYSGLRTWGWLLFGLFALRGVDRMIEVMSVYHI